MNIGNTCVTILFITILLFAIGYFVINREELFIKRSTTYFVLLNQLNLFLGALLCAGVYHWDISWGWKLFSCIFIFDIMFFGMLFIKGYLPDFCYDELEIENGILKKVHASQSLRILKLPKECVQIADNAFDDLPELEEIYFGKNIKEVSIELLDKHYVLHTLHFANSKTKCDDIIKTKYTIKRK